MYAGLRVGLFSLRPLTGVQGRGATSCPNASPPSVSFMPHPSPLPSGFTRTLGPGLHTQIDTENSLRTLV